MHTLLIHGFVKYMPLIFFHDERRSNYEWNKYK